jgi:hypothetical protein
LLEEDDPELVVVGLALVAMANATKNRVERFIFV